jgi:hypothetical protein
MAEEPSENTLMLPSIEWSSLSNDMNAGASITLNVRGKSLEEVRTNFYDLMVRLGYLKVKGGVKRGRKEAGKSANNR